MWKHGLLVAGMQQRIWVTPKNNKENKVEPGQIAIWKK